jgi:hypothetical protein
VSDAVEAFVSYQPEEHEPDPETREAYDDAYRRYRGRVLRAEADVRYRLTRFVERLRRWMSLWSRSGARSCGHPSR